MAKYDYNVIVIGGGAGGLVSSYIASAVNAKVALIEKHKMGGDCLNTGCVPSKALIRTAKIVSDIHNYEKFGLTNASSEIDFQKVMERVQAVIEKIEPHDSIERYTKLGVECFTGEALIRSPHEVEVNGKILTTRSIIVATGASPLVPPIVGLDKVDYLTSDTLWDIRDLPKRLLVLGGGAIGCELAQAFNRLGSDVTIVDMAPQLLPREDEDVAEFLSHTLDAEGITVLTGLKVQAFEGNSMLADHSGKALDIPFDKVILALGRKANVSGFGLEELGVTLNLQGTISADPFLRTNIPNIYVCGDVTGPYQFTHVAAHQAWYAAVNALFAPLKKFKVDYGVIPWCMFTDPEIAHVGLSEKEAQQQDVAYEVTKYNLDDLDRAIVDSAACGFVKVLTKPNSDKILGATIVGSHAGELLAEFVLAMKHGLGLQKILGTIHTYPTMSEAAKYAAGNWKKAHAPQWALNLLQKFFAWRR